MNLNTESALVFFIVLLGILLLIFRIYIFYKHYLKEDCNALTELDREYLETRTIRDD